MSFFYSDNNEPFTGSRLPLSEINKNNMHLKHLENWFQLKFILVAPGATLQEKHQATKELDICERKLAYWSKFSDFDEKKAQAETMRLKRIWGPHGVR